MGVRPNVSGNVANRVASIGEGTAREDCRTWPKIYVVVVTYRARHYICECLDSLLATAYPNLRIIVVDNASPDGTADVVEQWMTSGPRAALRTSRQRARDHARPQEEDVILLEAGENGGFAGGVNRGLELAMRDGLGNLYWILNPDTVVEPQTPYALARKAEAMGEFGVIGGRVLYLEAPDRIQTDGGRVHRLAGTAISVNIGDAAAERALPAADTLDYIPGVSMLASRRFLETAGLLPEHYFLYFEEIDWQLARGSLPLGIEPEARVLHRAGASIGSAMMARGASPLAVYFTCRNLMRFVWRWSPAKLPAAYLFAYYKLWRQWRLTPANLVAALRGLHGLPPAAATRRILPDRCWRMPARRRTRSAAPAAGGKIFVSPKSDHSGA